MTILEKEILFIISRLRCLTETQFNKLFNYKRDSKKKTLKRTLRRMCNDYILVKFPCNINYRGYKENSYLYYINGSSEFYKGEDLIKALISSDIAVKLNLANFDIVRFYRNINIGDNNYSLYIEYIDNNCQRKQVLFDMQLGNTVDLSKYYTLKADMKNTTIPFFMVPNIIVVTNRLNEDDYLYIQDQENIFLVDISLHSMFRYL
ncbi:hypothetical protein [Intestinibacter sp.]|uniref:hypothetical protein n=1 Tax=Intestinibacter sp. TaxID=1965304 RepID=UPI003F171C7F